MQMEADHPVVWIRGPKLRKRLGGMANSTFYDKINRGHIPEPEYPFGDRTPYWRLAVIEAIEARAAAQAEMKAAAAPRRSREPLPAVAEKPHPAPTTDAAAPSEPVKRKPGRPR